MPFLSKSSAASSGEGGLLPCLAVCAEMARNGVAVGHEQVVRNACHDPRRDIKPPALVGERQRAGDGQESRRDGDGLDGERRRIVCRDEAIPKPWMGVDKRQKNPRWDEVLVLTWKECDPITRVKLRASV